MGCIFYDGEICLAQPKTIKGVRLFKPSPEQGRAFCGADGYTSCPKYTAYVAHLKRVKEEQERTVAVPG